MEEFVLQRILGELSRRRRGHSEKPADSLPRVFYIRFIRPDRPEIQPERSMKDVKNDGNRQHGASDPVISNPGKPNPQFRKEGGKQKREHGRSHDPMKQPRD